MGYTGIIERSGFAQELIAKGEGCGRAEGEARGRAKGEAGLVLRLLRRRVGQLGPDVAERVRALPVSRIEDLAEAAFDFTQPVDLDDWLRSNT